MRIRSFIPAFLSASLTEDEALLRNSRLFDETFYREQAKLRPSANAAIHYLTRGWRTQLNPSRYFNTKFYLDSNADVRASKINPLLHFVKNGFREMRRPCQEFDPLKFKLAHQDLPNQNAAELCLQIYGTYAWTSGKRRSNVSEAVTLACKALFDPVYYRSTYCELDWSTSDPFFHYMEYGHLLGCDPSIAFDTDYYRKTWMQNDRIFDNPLAHFVTTGAAKGLATCESEGIVLDPAQGLTTKKQIAPSFCIHAHCFYPEMLGEILPAIDLAPPQTHLVVTVVSEADLEFAEKYLARSIPTSSFSVMLVDNRGRDLIPFLIPCSAIWKTFDIVLHIHTKASPHLEWGHQWRAYLFDQLFGSKALLETALDAFGADPAIGMLYPANFYKVKEYIPNDVNHASIDALMAKTGLFRRFSIPEFCRRLDGLLPDRCSETDCGTARRSGDRNRIRPARRHARSCSGARPAACHKSPGVQGSSLQNAG